MSMYQRFQPLNHANTRVARFSGCFYENEVPATMKMCCVSILTGVASVFSKTSSNFSSRQPTAATTTMILSVNRAELKGLMGFHTSWHSALFTDGITLNRQWPRTDWFASINYASGETSNFDAPQHTVTHSFCNCGYTVNINAEWKNDCESRGYTPPWYSFNGYTGLYKSPGLHLL